MREVKVFTAKKGGRFLVSFEKGRDSFMMKGLDNHFGIRDLLWYIFPSPEAADKAIKKISGVKEPSLGSKLIIMPDNTVDRTEAKYAEWVEKMKRMFERKGSISDPTIMSGGIKSRISTIGGSINFAMNLKDYKGEQEKREIFFSFQVAGKATIYADYDSRWGVPHNENAITFRSAESPVMIGVPADKFNYLTYDKGRLGFCDNKEVNKNHFNLPRQDTKMSKVIRDLFDIYEARISDSNYSLFQTYHLSNSELHPESMYNGAVANGVKHSDIQFYLQKGKERLFELLIAEFKPKEFVIRTTKNIDKIYGTPKAEAGSGTLANSCMSEHNRSSYSCARAAGFYNNLDNVRIVYALDKNKNLFGRAILWSGFMEDKETNKHTKPIKFLDRIYGSEDFVSAVREWAAKRDYYWKLDQSAGATVLTNKDGEQLSNFKTTVFKLGFGEVNRNVPYFDTMKYFNVLSKSTKYAMLQLSSAEQKLSGRMSGTDAAIVVVKCGNCGVILVKNLRTESYYEPDRRKPACIHCSTNYGGSSFVKTDEDAKLSFSSHGHKRMPKMIQGGKLVTVKIGKREVSFDIDDHNGIKNFFHNKTSKDTAFKADTVRHEYKSARSNNGPW